MARLNHHTYGNLMTSALAACISLAGCVTLTACTPQQSARLDANMLLEIEQLRMSNEKLNRQLAQRDEQVAALQKLGDKRLDQLYTVLRIALASGTGGTSLDDKPGDDGVKVNVQPIDQHGSVLKAAGSVKVQVFDLALTEGKNLLAEREHDPNSAAKNWVSGLFGSYYSFTIPLPFEPAHSELTVRAEFTEYLTGKTFTAQQVIKSALPPKVTSQPATTQPTSKPTTQPSAATARALFVQAGQQWAILADANASAAQRQKAAETLGTIHRFVKIHDIPAAPSADHGWCGTNALMRENLRQCFQTFLLTLTDPNLTDPHIQPKLSQEFKLDMQRLATVQRDDCLKYSSDTSETCLDMAMVPR